MILPDEPLYLPFEAGPFRMTLGLVARTPDDLISLDEHYPAQIERRRTLVAQWGTEVAAAEPGAAPACREMLERLATVLPRRYPEMFETRDDGVHNRITGETWSLQDDSLTTAALLVQEDLCLLELRDGVPYLIAGTLCFSPGWRLLEKLGQRLGDVHVKVPLYAERLGRPVDRLMRYLQRGKLVERLNWGLYDNDALFRPGRHFRSERNPEITPDNALDRLFLRVERQTLSVLPRTGAILFTIRTHVYPLSRVIAVEGAAGRLNEAVRALPPEMALYKSVAPFRDALLDALQNLLEDR
ncbi:MAG: DUF3445 domain-containing protein [Alphaproteobacteria bacterium]|nr:MAG: DUF3445 domain-containing protein [Alphaproteobacteria bacterium]